MSYLSIKCRLTYRTCPGFYYTENIHKNYGLHFSQQSLLIDAAIRGQGIALVGDVIVSDELATGKLVKLFESTDIPQNFSFHLVYAEAKADLPRIQLFREWILAEVNRIER